MFTKGTPRCTVLGYRRAALARRRLLASTLAGVTTSGSSQSREEAYHAWFDRMRNKRGTPEPPATPRPATPSSATSSSATPGPASGSGTGAFPAVGAGTSGTSGTSGATGTSGYWSTDGLFRDSELQAERDREEQIKQGKITALLAQLGLGKDASWADVNVAYKRLAKEHHPDRNADKNPHTAQHHLDQMLELNRVHRTLRSLMSGT